MGLNFSHNLLKFFMVNPTRERAASDTDQASVGLEVLGVRSLIVRISLKRAFKMERV